MTPPPSAPPRPALSAVLVCDGLPRPGASLALVAGVWVLFSIGGGALEVWLGEVGALAAAWLFILGPVLLFLRVEGLDAPRTLSLSLPSARHLGGALLLWAGALPLAWTFVWLQGLVAPLPPQIVQGMETLVRADDARGLLWLGLVLAATPAVCEEALFRGVLLAGTLRLGPRRALLMNAAAFAAFHLSAQTSARLLPAALLGWVIAWTVWRSGSILTGVLMHFLNNTTVVLLASYPTLSRILFDGGAKPSLWLAPVAVICAGGGFLALSGPAPGRLPPPLGNQEK